MHNFRNYPTENGIIWILDCQNSVKSGRVDARGTTGGQNNGWNPSGGLAFDSFVHSESFGGKWPRTAPASIPEGAKNDWRLLERLFVGCSTWMDLWISANASWRAICEIFVIAAIPDGIHNAPRWGGFRKIPPGFRSLKHIKKTKWSPIFDSWLEFRELDFLLSQNFVKPKTIRTIEVQNARMKLFTTIKPSSAALCASNPVSLR